MITLLTNDLASSPIVIAALYNGRRQIELLFCWIERHLKIRKFLGNNGNAIRLQLRAAMTAYALGRIAAGGNPITITILNFTDLVTKCLFERRPIAANEKPPLVNPRRRKDLPDQMSFCYV